MDHGGCALEVGVASNRIVAVKGDPRGLLNRGYVCTKGKASAYRLDYPGRLRHPLRRTGPRGAGGWEPISWETAIGTIAERLAAVREADGARAVAFCQGMPKGLEHFVLIRLANTFGSPNVVAVQDVCHAPREISGGHTCGFYPVVDLRHPSRLVVLWGSNIDATNEEGGICRLLHRQRRQGTELMVIDPVETDLAKRARYWLRVRPGSDHLLALAFLHVIIAEGRYYREFVEKWTHGFNELASHVRRYSPDAVTGATGVPPELIREGARCYAAARPAALAWGNPIEQTENAFDAARALTCLMAICGNLDAAGGNIQPLEPKVLSLGRFVRADLIPDKRREMIHAHHGTIPRLMTVPPEHFRQAVLEKIPYPVRAAYIQCANPMLSWADSRRTRKTLENLDFLAVSDVVMTPTSAMADVVLPAATHFEFNDIGHYGLGHGVVLARPKVVDPPPDCWPDMKILNTLGRALCDPGLWYDDWQELLGSLLAPSGLTYDQFAGQGYLTGAERFEKYRDGGFRTPTGKVELYLSTAEKFGLAPLPGGSIPAMNPDYPLVLTSAKDPCYLHSSYRWIEALRSRSPLPMARIHPDTAAALGVGDRAPVRIETRFGVITQTARVTDSVPPGVVLAAYGWWFTDKDSSVGPDWESANYNMLTTSEPCGREFGTPNLKGIACRIRPA
jgi:anaerobic selenocysteine-containing dehydrogenase